MLVYVLISGISLLLLWLFRSREDPAFSNIPGPKPLPLVGNSLMFVGPSEHVWLKTMLGLRNEFGNVVMLYIGTKPQILLFEAEGFDKILSSSRNKNKGFQCEFLLP